MKIDINKSLPTSVSLAIIVVFTALAVALNWFLWNWAYKNQPQTIETSANASKCAEGMYFDGVKCIEK
ncbi:MAG: hypothetical protein NT026_02385 [Candidatus Staskawiczbacteria bacterium]|nr:hypothetical protein [Candidatus Staskawiczbacteria bacterium]